MTPAELPKGCACCVVIRRLSVVEVVSMGQVRGGERNPITPNTVSTTFVPVSIRDSTLHKLRNLALLRGVSGYLVLHTGEEAVVRKAYQRTP